MAPVIDIIRTGETADFLDPPLTEEGLSQAAQLGQIYQETIDTSNVSSIISSPMNSAIQTCLVAFKESIHKGRNIVLLPELQETGIRAADTPLAADQADIAKYGEIIDYSNVDPDFWIKTRATRFEPTPEKVELRASCARRFIQDFARTAGDTGRVVVVTHGAFAHFLAGDFSGLTEGGGRTAWPEAGMRSYTFADLEGDDEEPELVETPESCAQHEHKSWAELGPEDRKRLRGYALEELLMEPLYLAHNIQIED
ncbi:hypothetical protein F4810DRAFT_721212 [Camillea tinctor]|nr:hypothetical protein F4810DRAFT_721212 [Camillea tinctor]